MPYRYLLPRNTLMREIGRLITAMATPFTPNGDLDLAGAAQLANHLLDTGTVSLVLNGTTGESPTLTHDEKLKLLDAVLESVGGRAPIIMGTGSNATADTIHLTQEAKTHGADAALVVVPYYNKPPQDALYCHFSQVADASDLPLMLYNIPGRCGVDLLPETVVRLSQNPLIFAVKEASGIVTRTPEILCSAREGFRVYTGDDSTVLPMMALGAYGVVSVMSHVAGPQISDLIDAHLSGNRYEAIEINNALLPLAKALFISSNPAPLKCALGLLGLPGGPLRMPLMPVTADQAAIVKRALDELHITA